MIATMSGVVISYNFMGFVFIFWTFVLNTSCNIYPFICCLCFCCTCLQLKLTTSRDLCAWCCIMLRHKEIHIVRHSKTQFCRLWDFVKTHCCIAVRQTRLFSPTGSQNLDLLALHFAKLSDNRPYL